MSYGQGAHGGCAAGLRVLVVEDHADTRQALRRLLSLLGCAVSTAGTAAEARQALAGGGFDLLLCDLQLPDGDGRDLLREAHEAPGEMGGDGRPVRGLAVTGETEPAAVARTRDAGFCDHLAKPVVWADLEAAVRRAAGGRCPRRPRQAVDAGPEGLAAGCPQCSGIARE